MVDKNTIFIDMKQVYSDKTRTTLKESAIIACTVYIVFLTF